MSYLVTFLEVVITFISPCLLPMLPIYLSYFAAGTQGPGSTRATAKNALGFILGFTVTFLLLGTLAGSVGMLLYRWQFAVNLICGAVVVLFGLNFLGVLNLRLFEGGVKWSTGGKPLGFFSAVLFGLVFSVGWTPCVGAFLGSALMLASQQGSVMQGTLLLLSYSLGLGVPFFLSALLIQKLKGALDWVKAHYSAVNTVCGVFLVAVGILMMTGLLDRFLAVLA